MRLRSILVFLALATAIFVSAGGQARADDFKGWFVLLDLADTQPNSLNMHYANVTDLVTNDVTRLTLDNDADLSYRLGGGYSWGKMGKLMVSYWTFNNEDEESGAATGYLYPTIFGYGQVYGQQYLYSPTFKAKGKVQAMTFDVDYARPFETGEKMTISWMAGLRIASYEETQSFTGTNLYATYTYAQKKNFKNDGWGPKIGVNVDWGFTDRFSLAGTAAFSFMQISSDGDASQASDTGLAESVSVSDDNVRGLIMDFDLRGVWSWDHFGFWVGYSMSDWGGISTDPLPAPNGFGGPTYPNGRDDISFNSVHAGLKWKFGGH